MIRDSNTIEGTMIQDKWGLSVTGIQLESHLNIIGSSKHSSSVLFFWSTKEEKKKSGQ